ncbi:MAG: family 43 glycosylhydrolase [Acidobacteria bacterium]|nr:family 43 glycosylhydrolase [Acidobacteriota bacterium]
MRWSVLAAAMAMMAVPALAQKPGQVLTERRLPKNPQDAAAVKKMARWTEGRIVPGAVWNDENGKPIQAHGGGILKYAAYWYWFGEDRTRLEDDPTRDPAKRYVHVYKSKDLIHWENRGVALAMAEPEDVRAAQGGRWVLERPKVFRILKPKTGAPKFVMYMHLDAGGRGYNMAEVGVAVSDKIEGPYRFVKHFRPLGKESRDIGQFVDDDAHNYLIFESRPSKGFYIARLSDDGMDVSEVGFVHAPLEGGAIVHYEGLYYVLGSHLTGWAPNPNVYATSTSLVGPWSEFKDVAPPETNTYATQSSMLIKVTGTKRTAVIYVGDRWEPETLWDSRYVWMPVEIGNGVMRLPEPRPWTIDVVTGVVKAMPPYEK